MLAHDHLPLSDEDRRACREMIRAGSKSFHAASLLLPPKVRDAAISLYAFCRLSDDMVDEGEDRLAALKDLRHRLDLAYRGRPFDHVADRAFAATVRHYEIPREVPEALIEGYEWDVDGRLYETIDELVAYSTRVAATVGVMMTIVMGKRASHTLARAADLGVAMQLTNIARDVGEDARNGRVYLPLNWLQEEGLSAQTLIDKPEASPELGRVVKRLLREASILYTRGFTGIRDLPWRCRSSIRAAGLVYRDIGREIVKNGYDSVSKRAYTSKKRKAFLCLSSLIKPGVFDVCDLRPPLSETKFLVDAASRKAQVSSTLLSTIDGRMFQLASLIEALEERDRVSFERRRRTQ